MRPSLIWLLLDVTHDPLGIAPPAAFTRGTTAEGHSKPGSEARRRRVGKSTAPANLGARSGASQLPLQAFAKNQIWLELVQLAAELLTWTQLLAWSDTPARTWEPKRLRLRLLAVAGKLVTTGRRRILRLSRRWPWSDLLTNGQRNLAALN